MSFSDDVYELLKTSIQISDIRVGNMPADSGMIPLLNWRNEVVDRFYQEDMKKALDVAFSELEKLEDGGKIAEYLRQEVNAVHAFQASLLEINDDPTPGRRNRGRRRPLQGGLKMAQTVFGSLKDILDLDKRSKALLVIMEEVWGIFAA